MLYLQRNVDQVHGKTKRTTGWLSRAGLLKERLRELGLPYRGGKHERGSAQHSISGTAFKDVKDLFREKKRKKGSGENAFSMSLMDTINNTRLDLDQGQLSSKIRNLFLMG